MTAPGRIIPPSLTAQAAARPRDASGRVTLPIRIEVKLPGGRGFRRYCETWDEVIRWMASEEFTAAATAIRSIVIVAQRPDLSEVA